MISGLLAKARLSRRPWRLQGHRPPTLQFWFDQSSRLAMYLPVRIAANARQPAPWPSRVKTIRPAPLPMRLLPAMLHQRPCRKISGHASPAACVMSVAPRMWIFPNLSATCAALSGPIPKPDARRMKAFFSRSCAPWHLQVSPPASGSGSAKMWPSMLRAKRFSGADAQPISTFFSVIFLPLKHVISSSTAWSCSIFSI